MPSFNDPIVLIKQGQCKCFTLVNNSCFNRYCSKHSDELHSLVVGCMLPSGFSRFSFFECYAFTWSGSDDEMSTPLQRKTTERSVRKRVWPCQNSFTDNHQIRRRWDKEKKREREKSSILMRFRMMINSLTLSRIKKKVKRRIYLYGDMTLVSVGKITWIEINDWW